MNKSFLVCFLIVPLIFACTRYKDITYVKDVGKTPNDTLYTNSFTDYKIQVADILYVRISCMDENINALFNQGSQSNSSSSSSGSFYLTGNTVDIDGNITVPVIGKVPAAGQTVSEIESNILKLSAKFITDANVQVKLVSFKISLLGEIGSKGQINIFSDRANIFEVLALAGDINYGGNRHNVLIMRTTKHGTEIHRIDVTDKNILSSNMFYLQPNDIIYVEPMKSIGLKLIISDYSALISLLTLTISTYFLISNLTK
jgi:polysaccharide export outer membrane protein